MTDIEKVAISLHDHLWLNLGVGADWPIQLGGSSEEMLELIRLMNSLQHEIMRDGKQTFEYNQWDKENF